MQTRLPCLSYVNYGKAILDSIHSSSNSTPRSHPRTDLNTLAHWDAFPLEIHEAIVAAMKKRSLTDDVFDIHGWTDDDVVGCEEELRCHASYVLHTPVEQVLNKLGLQGRFRMPGSGNSAIIGSPDFFWVVDPVTKPHPIVVVEYKPWWVVDLTRVLAAFSDTDSDYMAQQTLEAIEQIYAYMTFNNSKYGILTTWRHAMFLRRVETADRKHLEYFVVDLEGPSSPISMLKAWVGVALLACNNWFEDHAALTACNSFKTSLTGLRAQMQSIKITEDPDFNVTPINGTYKLLTLDFRLCQYDLGSARERGNGCIVSGHLTTAATDSLDVVFKVVDACRYDPESPGPELLQNEADIYAFLYELQGRVIPKVYGLYEIWGTLHVLALQPVGTALDEDGTLSHGTLQKMKSALQSLHNAGFLHGDINQSHFCQSEDGDIFLVDLTQCRPSADQGEMDDEMAQVDALEHI